MNVFKSLIAREEFFLTGVLHFKKYSVCNCSYVSIAALPTAHVQTCILRNGRSSIPEANAVHYELKLAKV